MSEVSHIPPLPFLLKEGEVAQILRVHRRTVRRLADIGTLPSVQVGGVRRYRSDHVVALIVAGAPLNDRAPADDGREITTSAVMGDGHAAA